MYYICTECDSDMILQEGIYHCTGCDHSQDEKPETGISQKEAQALVAALEGLMKEAAKDAEMSAPEGNEPIWAWIDDASHALANTRN
jgi:hypothetical protein|tara:strand:- start:658 stop:918 length:261 start_codon:yes stop_codon:yes gene_type:complete